MTDRLLTFAPGLRLGSESADFPANIQVLPSNREAS
jgi:hypothetical protein